MAVLFRKVAHFTFSQENFMDEFILLFYFLFARPLSLDFAHLAEFLNSFLRDFLFFA